MPQAHDVVVIRPMINKYKSKFEKGMKFNYSIDTINNDKCNGYNLSVRNNRYITQLTGIYQKNNKL